MPSGSKWSRETPSPLQQEAVMDGPVDGRIRAVRDGGEEVRALPVTDGQMGGVGICVWIYGQVGRERVSLMRDRLREMDGWDIYSDG